MKKREKNKPQENQVMHNAITSHPLTDVQPVPQQGLMAPGQFLPSLCSECHVLGYGMSSLWPVWVNRPGHAPPRLLCTCFLAEHGKLKTP